MIQRSPVNFCLTAYFKIRSCGAFVDSNFASQVHIKLTKNFITFPEPADIFMNAEVTTWQKDSHLKTVENVDCIASFYLGAMFFSLLNAMA